MFTFQSNDRECDVQLSNKSVASFRNYTFTTDSEKKAALVRERCGKGIWELSAIVVTPETESAKEPEAPAPKRRGRPPKIVQGMRMVENKGDEQ